MAIVITDNAIYYGIGDAIREKNGSANKYLPEQMPDAIRAIHAGSSDVSLESISVITPPTKLEYKTGEIFNPAGLVVQAVFSNGDTVNVDDTGIAFEPSTPLEETDAAITISLTFDGKTLTIEQPIVVSGANVFGVMWDSSNPSTALIRLTKATDPNGLVNVDIATEPVPAIGNGEGSSPFDDYLPWSGMEEYNIINNEVKYKRGDIGFSRTLYDTMVYIPEFWYKTMVMEEKNLFYISDNEKNGFEKHPGSGKYVGRYNTSQNGTEHNSFSNKSVRRTLSEMVFREKAEAKGDKWHLYDFPTWCALGLLYRIEYADWNSQEKIGKGIVDSPSVHPVGETDIMEYHTGRVAGENGKTAIQYRHVENVFGNIYDGVDGISFRDYKVHMCLDYRKYSNVMSSDYEYIGITLKSVGYPKSIHFYENEMWAFIPNAHGGSDSNYIPDYHAATDGVRVLNVGGSFTDGLASGMFCFYGAVPVDTGSGYAGSRLIFEETLKE